MIKRIEDEKEEIDMNKEVSVAMTLREFTILTSLLGSSSTYSTEESIKYFTRLNPSLEERLINEVLDGTTTAMYSDMTSILEEEDVLI